MQRSKVIACLWGRSNLLFVLDKNFELMSGKDKVSFSLTVVLWKHVYFLLDSTEHRFTSTPEQIIVTAVCGLGPIYNETQ